MVISAKPQTRRTSIPDFRKSSRALSTSALFVSMGSQYAFAITGVSRCFPMMWSSILTANEVELFPVQSEFSSRPRYDPTGSSRWWCDHGRAWRSSRRSGCWSCRGGRWRRRISSGNTLVIICIHTCIRTSLTVATYIILLTIIVYHTISAGTNL